ncbi:DNA gyrase inhibitor YacG [Candidatus Binatia bacterium]|jgi:endogenous inhibitor of DNA gyrase (YacG/DUF329 family)|nr:DNA gyrase inhibitor YacG [Candidatus Binatia bacterium]
MRVVACPQCGAETPWEGNSYRPFCSERCRLIDLGAWLDEKYAIPAPLDDESADDEAGTAMDAARGGRNGRHDG